MTTPGHTLYLEGEVKRLQQEVEHLRAYQQQMNDILIENSNLRGVRDQLRQELSLAEEGLANYTLEVQRLQQPYRDAQHWKAQHLIAIQEVERLKEEIDVLRLYGNKDCTAMADAELRRRGSSGHPKTD